MKIARAVRKGPLFFCALLCFLFQAIPCSLRAEDQSARVVDVVLERSVTVPAAGATHLLVVDDDVCRAELVNGTLRLDGVKRGETIVVVWTGGATETLLVRVNAAPPPETAHHATQAEAEALGQGTVGSLAHLSTTSAGGRGLTLLTPFSWSERAGGRRFAMFGQLQGVDSGAETSLDLEALSAQWTTARTAVNLLDFAVNLDGGARARIHPSVPSVTFALRGADVTVRSGPNVFEGFAGATLPLFTGSRQLAGFNVSRQINDRVSLDATSAFLRTPASILPGSPRQMDGFQTAGFAARVSDRAAFQLRAGAGTGGVYGQAAASWDSERVSAFLSATGSSPEFGLSKLQLVFAPRASLLGSGSVALGSRVHASVGLNHVETAPTAILPAASTSDNLSATVNAVLTRRHTLFVTETVNRTEGGLAAAGPVSGRRIDAGISSQFGRAVINTIQVSSGALADPLQVSSRGEFAVRDTAAIAVGSGVINVSVSHDRLSPSLVSRLEQQLDLLAPGLQPLFLNDPVGFVTSPLLPPDVRQVLDSLEPVDTQVVLSGQFKVGARLTVSPTLSYLHDAQSSSLATHNQMVGYSLNWRVTPTFELQSSLSNALVFDPRRAELSRATTFGIGFRKSFSALPRWIRPSAGYRIRGRVFRDLNVDGVADPSDPGLAGVTIRLSDGRATPTDRQGRFEFNGLSAGEYRVLMPLDQFGRGVRVTTSIDPVVRLYERSSADVDFGIVNFSRVMGTVFNDYALDGVQQADSPGLRDAALVISGEGAERRIATDGAGEFQIDDLPPGHYTISVDGSTLPPNYEPARAPATVDVGPSSSANISLPVRALRSIAGHVFIRTDAAGTSTLTPIRGVRLAAHGSTAVTDEEGRFVLRNLPAGELSVAVVPAEELPEGLQAPIGRVRMPTDPIQVDSATIIIDNPYLLRYLVPAN